MECVYKGNVSVLGNNVDTDQIYPGRYLALVDPEEIKSHCLEDYETLHRQFKKGDIIAAGSNFGCGSSREHAVIAIMHMGASMVIADSFARIFYRNALNLGLPLMVCRGISKKVKDGDVLEADIETGVIKNLTRGEEYAGECVGEYALEILKAGGIKPLMRKRMMAEKE
ncbi:3-isopropylmalate dehydratase small subunit [Clostridium sp. MCC353]|uniref:LeuD/DmdB family oxidoreductase small subunit n=1 Tax=Clostridium sp. MCC353 TaxID=2592646 RepID=UPI001C01798A|nr:3-isopropylmalate dehydratase small subunit [Clostridium sp. MCC353]MBT9778456.1 3-isopropylmalate dehydratase small subunit [Clostridium sp. MCC353]